VARFFDVRSRNCVGDCNRTGDVRSHCWEVADQEVNDGAIGCEACSPLECLHSPVSACAYKSELEKTHHNVILEHWL